MQACEGGRGLLAELRATDDSEEESEVTAQDGSNINSNSYSTCTDSLSLKCCRP